MAFFLACLSECDWLFYHDLLHLSLSLLQNKRQLEEIKKQREEEERARLAFSVIVYKKAFMLKISNVGKRNVFNAIIQFNEDFLNELFEEKFQEGYKKLAKPFFVEAGTSKHLYIGWCHDINDAWKNKHVVIEMKGHYNDVYTIDETIDMDLYLDKTFMLVQGEIATELALIKQGLVNNSYSPIQVNIDRITKSLASIETSLNDIAEKLEKPIEEMFDTENKVKTQPFEKNKVSENDSGEEKETGDQ